MKPLDYILDGILAILFMFMFTLLYFGLKQDSMVETLVQTDTSDFVESVRSRGYLTKDMYDDFLDQLSKTGLMYDIDMEHRQLIREPKYRMRTVEEIINEQDSAFKGINTYHYLDVVTNIPTVTDPIYTGKLNTETNESILAKTINTPADPNHLHTDACKSHVHATLSATPFIHHHQHTASCIPFITYQVGMATCSSCGTRYQTLDYYGYWDTDSGSQKCSSVQSFNCPKCGGQQRIDIILYTSYAYSCGYSIDLNKDGYGDLVGTDKSYDYPATTPQDISTIATYKNGCWSYHNAVYLSYFDKSVRDNYGNLVSYNPGYYYNNGYMCGGAYIGSSGCYVYTRDGYYIYNCTATMKKILESNFKYYCRVPQYYQVGIYSPNLGEYYTALYKLSEDLTTFSYVQGSSTWPSWYGIYNTNSQDISVSDMKAYLNYSADFTTFLKPNMRAYIPDSSFVAIGLISVNNNSGADGMDAYGYDTCGHNAANEWYLDCNQDSANCNQVVMSILPTNPTQTVYQGDNIISTVIATHLDGSTKTIVASTSGYDKNIIGTQTVTLSYTGLVDNAKTTGTKICTISVTVVPRSKTCANGHTYNLNADDSDPGCPYCKAWLKSLMVKEPATGTISIYRGTTLKQNGVILQATYMNGSTEMVTDSYIDNLDKTYVGTQNVTLSYKGQDTHMTVIVKRNIVQCTVCGRYYELFPDDTNPGCPYCAAKTPIFTGNIMKYYDRKYTDEILKELYHGSGIYYFSRDDYLSIKLQNSSRSLGGKLTAAFYKSLADGNIRTQDGGYIRQIGQ